MITMRSRFYKKDDMVFISHLDLLRVFERAIKRADIPVAYTQGFNPRPIMAFATALAIGVASEGEYVDIQLTDNMSSDLFMNNLNSVLPEGLKIIKSISIDKKVKSLMSIISSSIYLVKLKTSNLLNEEDIREYIKEFLNKDEIIQLKEKKQKRGRRSRNPEIQKVNIKPFIKALELFSVDGHELLLKMDLVTGSRGNLKAEVVVDKLQELTDLKIEPYETRIQRLDLFTEKDGKLMTPLDEGVWNS